MTFQKVVLAKPRGFCAGVERAIKVVEDCLEIFGKPVYIKHEIVHNRHVVQRLTEKGAITVNNIKEIPEKSIAVFSAHGSSPEEFVEARKKGMRIIDATCPLVTKVHLEVHRYHKEGYQMIYIGHKGHAEALGVLGELPGKISLIEKEEDIKKLSFPEQQKLVFLTQTTLSVDETKDLIKRLKERFPNIKEPPSDDICYATTNRQAGIKALAKITDIILIAGSQNSSNSKRLVETAESHGVPSYLIDDVSHLKQEWLENKNRIGISSGASVPDHLVQELAEYFVKNGAKKEELETVHEEMKFREPIELIKIKREIEHGCIAYPDRSRSWGY